MWGIHPRISSTPAVPKVPPVTLPAEETNPVFADNANLFPLTSSCRPKCAGGIAILIVLATCCSATLAQQPDKISFDASPVDALASKIKIDLQALKTTESAAPATAPDEAASDRVALVDTKASNPGAPLTSPKLKALEAAAMKCQTAEESLVLYKIFLANPDTTAEEKEQAQARYDHWEGASADQLVRVGLKWMGKNEAAALEKQADELAREAAEMLNVDNSAGATTKLEKATRVYPEHPEAVFLLAVNSYLRRDFKIAETKFSQCLARTPNSIALLNNVALCEVQLKRFPSAVKHWSRAASLDLENADVAQNLGQFVTDANQKRFGSVDKKTLAEATELYQQMITKDPGIRTDPTRGYVIVKKRLPGTAIESPSEESAVVGCATGFVIADGFVLTNRHVADVAEALAIEDPSKSDGLPHFAKVIAVSKELDLALLECSRLKAPAVPVSKTPVDRGTEVLAFGFPTDGVIGRGLKTARATITGLPSDITDRMLVLDSELPVGSSGGPLCDRRGFVVGIASPTTIKAALLDTYGQATPLSDALPFIKQNIPDYAAPKVESKVGDWTDVETLISQSMVMILIQKQQ